MVGGWQDALVCRKECDAANAPIDILT